jgi:flagellar basal body-associated protein FliL
MASEKPPAKPAEAPAAAAAAEAPKKNSMMKMIIVAAVVLVLEGGTVGVTMMLSAGPKKVMAEQPATAPAEAVEHDVEVKLIDATRLPNSVGGREYLYILSIAAKVDEKNKAKATELLAEREAETKDRIRTIIASSDPKSLAEPGLETLKRQIAYQLDEILGQDGKGLIKEVLIPQCTPQRAEY